ncbi:hypothetical protein CPB85DRAFT_698662 [Mucidula mucida]|nr:hypothetical protein CPB85DRAFT_698662 [Mucidula mucida]
MRNDCPLLFLLWSGRSWCNDFSDSGATGGTSVSGVNSLLDSKTITTYRVAERRPISVQRLAFILRPSRLQALQLATSSWLRY